VSLSRVDLVTGATTSVASGLARSDRASSEPEPGLSAYVTEIYVGALAKVESLDRHSHRIVPGGLSAPYAVAINSAETVRLPAEFDSGDFRQWTSDGAVRVVASGLNSPVGVALNSRRPWPS